MEDNDNQLWQTLPIDTQRLLTSQALNALLNGELYPIGSIQLELAIALAEAGVAAETISKLTRLDSELFAGFLKK